VWFNARRARRLRSALSAGREQAAPSASAWFSLSARPDRLLFGPPLAPVEAMLARVVRWP